MRILSYSEAEQIAVCSMQRGTRIYDVEIRGIEYVKKYDVYTEEFDIELISFEAFEWENDTEAWTPLTITNNEQYKFKRALLEYIDFDNDSEMFDSGDREGSCY